MAQRLPSNSEMKPLRWLMVRYMLEAFVRIDEDAEAGRPAPMDARLAQVLGNH